MATQNITQKIEQSKDGDKQNKGALTVKQIFSKSKSQSKDEPEAKQLHEGYSVPLSTEKRLMDSIGDLSPEHTIFIQNSMLDVNEGSLMNTSIPRTSLLVIKEQDPPIPQMIQRARPSPYVAQDQYKSTLNEYPYNLNRRGKTYSNVQSRLKQKQNGYTINVQQKQDAVTRLKEARDHVYQMQNQREPNFSILVEGERKKTHFYGMFKSTEKKYGLGNQKSRSALMEKAIDNSGRENPIHKKSITVVKEGTLNIDYIARDCLNQAELVENDTHDEEGTQAIIDIYKPQKFESNEGTSVSGNQVIISQVKQTVEKSRSQGTNMSKKFLDKKNIINPSTTVMYKKDDQSRQITDETKSNEHTNFTFSQAHHFMEPHMNIVQAPIIVNKLDLQQLQRNDVSTAIPGARSKKIDTEKTVGDTFRNHKMKSQNDQKYTSKQNSIDRHTGLYDSSLNRTELSKHTVFSRYSKREHQPENQRNDDQLMFNIKNLGDTVHTDQKRSHNFDEQSETIKIVQPKMDYRGGDPVITMVPLKNKSIESTPMEINMNTISLFNEQAMNSSTKMMNRPQTQSSNLSHHFTETFCNFKRNLHGINTSSDFANFVDIQVEQDLKLKLNYDSGTCSIGKMQTKPRKEDQCNLNSSISSLHNQLKLDDTTTILKNQAFADQFAVMTKKIKPDVFAFVQQKARYNKRRLQAKNIREQNRKKLMGQSLDAAPSQKEYLLKKDVYGRSEHLNHANLQTIKVGLEDKTDELFKSQLDEKYWPRERRVSEQQLFMNKRNSLQSSQKLDKKDSSTIVLKAEQNMMHKTQTIVLNSEEPKIKQHPQPYKIRFSLSNFSTSPKSNLNLRMMQSVNNMKIQNLQSLGSSSPIKKSTFLRSSLNINRKSGVLDNHSIKLESTEYGPMHIQNDLNSQSLMVLPQGQKDLQHDSLIHHKGPKDKLNKILMKSQKNFQANRSNFSKSMPFKKRESMKEMPRQESFQEFQNQKEVIFDVAPVALKNQKVLPCSRKHSMLSVFHHPYSKTEQGILDDMANFKANKKQVMQELFEMLDKGIYEKPIKLRAEIICQSVLMGGIDIDDALENYDNYLQKKHDQAQSNLDANHNKKLVLEKMMKKAIKKSENSKFKEMFPDLAHSSTEDSPRLLNNGPIVTTQYMLDQGNQYLNFVKFQKENAIKETPKITHDQVVKQQSILTEEQANMPLNKFFKKEVKQQLNVESGRALPKFKKVADPNQTIDQTQQMVAGQYVQQAVDTMSDLKFDYKQEFNLEKIRINMEKVILEKQKRQAEKERLLQSKGIDLNNQKKKNAPQPIQKPPGKAEHGKPIEEKKVQNKSKLATMMSKNKFKINTIAAMNSLKEKNYILDQIEINEKIINRTDFVVFMNNQQKRQSLQRSKTFGQDQISSHLKRINHMRQQRAAPIEECDNSKINLKEVHTKISEKNEDSSSDEGSQVGEGEEQIHPYNQRIKDAYEEHTPTESSTSSDEEENQVQQRKNNMRNKTKGPEKIQGARRKNFVVDDKQQLELQSIRQKERQLGQEALQVLYEFLKKELVKIKDIKKESLQKLSKDRNLMKLAHEQIAIIGSEGAVTQQKTQDKEQNIKLSELYREKAIEESIYEILRQSENALKVNEHYANCDDYLDNQGNKNKSCQKMTKEQVIFEHSKLCLKYGLLPLPKIFSAIVDQNLTLDGHLIGGQSHVIAEMLTNSAMGDNQIHMLKVINLNGCGLKDEGFANILRGLLKQKFIQSITYSNDELGEKSISKLQELKNLDVNQKLAKPLSEIQFYDLKIQNDSCKVDLLDTVLLFSSLRKMKISGINLSMGRVFLKFIELLEETQYLSHIQLLDFQNTYLKSKQIVQMSNFIAKNNMVSNINLSSNRLHGLNDQMEFAKNIVFMMSENPNIIHLNFSNMGLCGEAMLYLKKQGLDKCTTILSIHLSNNEFDKDCELEYHQLTDLSSKTCHQKRIVQSTKSMIEMDEDKAAELTNKEQDLVIQGKSGVLIQMNQIRQNHLDRRIFLEKAAFSNVNIEANRKKDNQIYLVNQHISQKLNQEIMINKKQMAKSLFEELVFSRKIGYGDIIFNKSSQQLLDPANNKKFFFKNAASQWLQELKDNDCYICNRSTQVMIFFRRNHVEQDWKLINNSKTKETLSNYYDLEKYKQFNPTQPLILGTLTDWTTSKMVPLLFFTLLRLLNQVQKIQTQQAQFSATNVKDQLEMFLNQWDDHNQEDPQRQHQNDENRKLLTEIEDSFVGWSPYLYDQIDQIQKSNSGLVVNFPYTHQDTEAIDLWIYKYTKQVTTPILDRHGKLKKDQKPTCPLEKSFQNKNANKFEPDSEDEIVENMKEELNQYRVFEKILQFENKELRDIYVFNDFVKPGLHTVLVYDPLIEQIYYKQISVGVRKQDHCAHQHNQVDDYIGAQNALKAAQEAEAQKRKQIFSEFKEDTTSIVKISFIRDTLPSIFKPYKFMPDQRQIDESLLTLIQNFKCIKDGFLILCAQSGNYPNLDDVYLTKFCIENNIVDEEWFTVADLQKIFLDANVEFEEDSDDANPDDLLNRKEFLETIMRIAQKKQNIYKQKYQLQLYKESYSGDQENDSERENKVSFEYFKEMNQIMDDHKNIPSIGHFVAKFIDETLQPLVDKYNSLDLRTDKINCNEKLCGVFLQNRSTLSKVYTQFQEKIRLDRPGKVFVLQSAINMVRLSLISESEISDNQIAVEFALSKMTVIDEIQHREQYYDLKYVEFQVFLSRLAFFLYKATPEQYQQAEQQQLSLKKQQTKSFDAGGVQVSTLYLLVERLFVKLFGIIGQDITPITSQRKSEFQLE